MKIIHTSDLHLGQVIYQHYDRVDEHDRVFARLEELCAEERPDALVVSGDVFDIQQPSASTWRYFTEHFVRLHRLFPEMCTVVTAGNHDSPSRLHSHRQVWREIGTMIAALPPSADVLELPEGWEDDFVIELPAGFIIAIPYMTGERTEVLQHLLDFVAERNGDGRPVVMTGHLAVAGSDVTGHDFDIGRLRATELNRLGTGYDYLALGHIHKPQTIGRPADCYTESVSYAAPVARYSGSVLHVSCDEAYPHSFSIVEIDRHGGEVKIRQRVIDELRHFTTLPGAGNELPADADAAIGMLKAYADNGGEGYVRFRLSRKMALPSDFTQRVYEVIRDREERIRYNPKIDWTGDDSSEAPAESRPRFEVAELQQMTDPMVFIEKTIDQYPGLSLQELREAFEEISEEVKRMDEQGTDNKKR